MYAYAVRHGLLSMGLTLNKRVEALPPTPASHQIKGTPVSAPMTASARRQRIAISSNYV